jgi:hypothetical protein
MMRANYAKLIPALLSVLPMMDSGFRALFCVADVEFATKAEMRLLKLLGDVVLL